MAKITFVGAGSTVFAKNLLGDILGKPELSASTIALHDIDPARLRTSEIVAGKTAAAIGAAPAIEATTDRRAALADADYVITMFQVGGYEPATVVDFEIPKQFGLRQTIGDTVGIGGIMRGLRTIPVLLDVCRDIEEVSADAVLLNYVNPMSMLCWAVSRASTVDTVGLCHSVQGTAEQLAGDLGVPIDEVRYRCAGINHMAFYLDFEHQTAEGCVDLYPAIAERAEGPAPMRGSRSRSDGGLEGLSDAVRYEMFKRVGYFVTESSEHFSEYVPYFIKRDRPDLLDRFGVPLDEYPRRCERQIEGWQALREELEDPAATIRVRPSHEYGSGIIHSMETGAPRVIYLDFTGHSTSGTNWNSSYSGGNPIVSAPFSIDADANALSDHELTFIRNVWRRVAEDFAPFSVDVTTQDPGVAGPPEMFAQLGCDVGQLNS